MLEQERSCFREILEPLDVELDFFNIIQERPSRDLLKRYDAFLVGGSGEFSVLDQLPFLPPFFEFLVDLKSHHKPLFASCFGFQALTLALGGIIVHDEPHTELGTYQLYLTEEGKKDPLFGTLPTPFWAQVGHKDRADRLPHGAVHLAYSELCPFHAFRMDDGTIYATQFHPELSARRNRERFEHYVDQYHIDRQSDAYREIIKRFREAPEAMTLIPRFLQRIFPELKTS